MGSRWKSRQVWLKLTIPNKELRSWFLAKSKLWEYEKEWRSIKRQTGKRQFPAAAISGIVIGCEASKEIEETVRKWIKGRRRKVILHRGVKQRSAFALVVERL